ncbi:MAG: hypothetical protein JW863_13215 [Chitinispirillaceae bacterium]|nr:hypothetical protein [Chitinispirillaceae bacterium]
MPTYEYRCDACGHTFEKFQSMTEEPLRKCPECDGQVKRLLGIGGGFILKGSGFHATDYPRASSAQTPCGRDTTCCGRETPCDKPPCGET